VVTAREVTAQIIEKLAQEYARFLLIEPYLWEYEPMLASGHFQDSIEPPRNFDAVILILESRLGTPMPERFHGMDGRTPVTGTEWEYEDALDGALSHKDRLPDLLVYRSRRKIQLDPWDAATRQEVLRQIEALDAFWSRHFSDGVKFIGAYSEFESLEAYAKRLEADLRTCVERRIARLDPEARSAAVTLWAKAPFRGLEAYEIEHAPIFFGREGAIGSAMLRLIGNAQAQRAFLLVLGASGSGKSSLVKAGIVSRLLVPQRVSGTTFLCRAVFRPSETRPDEDLFDALARVLERDAAGFREIAPGTLAQHLRQTPTHPDMPFVMVLDRLAQEARRAGRMLEYEQANLILIIDQMEELFTAERISAEDRSRFVQLLAGLVRSNRVWVIATMRADFWHRAAETPELLQLADGHGRLDLSPPLPAEISQMIRGPAEAAALGFETDANTGIPLNDLIAQDAAAEPGALPLLSYVLDQLYKRDAQDLGRSTLSYASYAELGGLKGAIATRAKAVVDAQPVEVRDALRQVLFALVQVSVTGTGVERHVARSAPLADFPQGTPKRRLIDALLDPSARLLVADDSSGAATVRLAHEALLTEWQAARDELEKSSSALRIRRTLEERYARWQKQKSDSDRTDRGAHAARGFPLGVIRERFGRERGLLTDLDLNDGRYLLREHREELPAPLVGYIERSSERDHARRQLTIRAVSAVALLMGILAAGAYYEATVARTESNTAGRTVKFLVSIFQQGDPEHNQGDTVTAKALLDQATTDIDHGLENEPRTRSELRTAMGESYAGLGVYPKAETLLSEAMADQTGINVPVESRVHTMTAYASAMLNNEPDDALGRLKKEDAAKGLLLQAVRLARSHLPSSSPARSEALTGLADLLADSDPKQAESLCLEALQADRQRGKDGAPILAKTLTSLGLVYYGEDEFAKAEASFAEAQAALQRAFGAHDARAARALNDLGAVQHEAGQDTQAIATYEHALPVYKEIYRNPDQPDGDGEHPELATLLNNIGRAELMIGNVDQAEPLFSRALAIDSSLVKNNRLSPNDSDFASTLNSLGMIDAYRGRWEDAGAKFERAKTIAELPGGQFLDQVLLNEADVALHNGDLPRAATLLTKSKAALQEAHKKDATNAWRYAVWDSVNAELLAAKGDKDGALRTLTAAAAVLQQRFGPTGFYPQLVERRVQLIQSKSTRAKS
jgi:tetratricopeptide (TPR) repeat protein/energy-coupling factor transporter ATP-binding protein EcfA2